MFEGWGYSILSCDSIVLLARDLDFKCRLQRYFVVVGYVDVLILNNRSKVYKY